MTDTTVPLPDESHRRLAELRRKVLAREPVTADEVREVLDSVRRERRAIPAEGGTKKKKVANVPVDTAALLSGLFGKKP